MSAEMIRVTDDPGAGQAVAPPPAAPQAPTSTGDVFQDFQTEVDAAVAARQVAEPAATPAPVPQTATPEPTPPAEPTAPQVEQPTTTVAPATEPPPSTPDPYSYQRLEEIAALPEAERAGQSVAFIRSRAQFDPIVHAVERYAMYEAELPTYQQWVMEDLLGQAGVTADQLRTRATEFASWLKAGAQALPTPQTPAPFPEFPQQDADGYVVVGSLRYDMADPGQAQAAREAYEDKKFIYDARIRQQQDEAAKTEQAKADTLRQQQEEQQRQAQVISQRNANYGTARSDAIIRVLDPIIPKFAPGDEWMEAVYAHTIKGTLEMLEYGKDEKGNPSHELGRLSRLAKPYVDAGAGRGEEIGKEIDRLAAIEVRKVVDQLNRFFLKANKAEVALTATQPQVPQQRTETVATPAAPSTQPTGSDQFMKDSLAEISQALANSGFQRR